MSHFGDDLAAAIETKRNPICVGLDPMYDALPDAVAGPSAHRDANDSVKVLAAYEEFCTTVIDTVAGVVPVVKLQSAYFEQYRSAGVDLYYRLVAAAQNRGLLVIGDIKRGDIGSTSAAYAEGHLAPIHASEIDDDEPAATPDAITINPMLGLDAIDPFVRTARQYGKGLFMLVRTSNPGSAALQDVPLADGRTWSESLADLLAPVADSLTGTSGFSSLGAVVGATQTHTIQSIRKRLPRSIFLLPGYGTQGATAAMTRAAFLPGGRGAIVSASRSILYAHQNKAYADFAADYVRCIRAAVDEMRTQIAAVLAAGDSK